VLILLKFHNSLDFYLNRLSSSSDLHQRSTPQIKKSERQILPRNQVFGVDSFLVSSSINISQQGTQKTNKKKEKKRNSKKFIVFLIKCHLFIHSDVPKIFAPPSKRYASSFKTLVNSTNSKQIQRLNCINNNFVIFNLSKNRKKTKTELSI